MDPHLAQSAVDAASVPTSWQVFHCTDVAKMPLEDVDPSCAFGILIRSESEYEATVCDLKQVCTINS